MNADLFSKNLRTVRKAKGLTQTELARRLFVTPQTVSKWEAGISFPDIENLCKLTTVLQTTPDRLLGIGAEGEPCYLGIDAGGTKTDAVLFRSDGTVLRRKKLPGANPNSCGLERAVEILSEALTLPQSGEDLRGVFAGVAGSAAADNKKKLTEALKKNLPGVPLSVDTDIENVISCIPGNDRCVAAISGTGTCVYAKTDGKLIRLGGYGYLFDNAGSGYDIGRDGIKACFEADDGLRPTSLLTDLIKETLGGTPWEKLDKLYTGGKDTIAALAPTVFRAARRGDETAKAILRQNFDRVADLIHHARARFNCGSTVVCAGGIAKTPEFEQALRQRGIEPTVPSQPPVYGACIHCAELYAQGADEEFCRNLSHTLLD